MKKIDKKEQSYSTPEIKQWALLCEGVLCASGNLEGYAGEQSENYLENF